MVVYAEGFGNKSVKLSSERPSGLAASHSLKSLNVTKSKLQRTIKRFKDEIQQANAGIKEAERQLKAVEKQIVDMQNSDEVFISEHALLRYIERYTDFDLESVRVAVTALPNSRIVKRGNTIVTILDENAGLVHSAR